MAETFYKQCTYESPIEGGVTRGHAWLPEKHAVLGKSIYFGKTTDVEKVYYTVTAVADQRFPETYVKQHERDYTTQREASDI